MANKVIDISKIAKEVKNKFKHLKFNETEYNQLVTKTALEAKKEFKGTSINEYKEILIKKLTNALMEYEKNMYYVEDKYDYDVENSYTQYIKDIHKLDIISQEEFKKLFKQYKKGDIKAKAVLILSNLRIVINIAKKYENRGADLLDIIQEGNLGLIKALENYDLNKGYPFYVYAYKVIETFIKRESASNSRNIKLPYHVYVNILKYAYTKQLLKLKLERNPSISEIANELNISIEEASQLEKLQYNTVSLNVKMIGENTQDYDSETISEYGNIIVDRDNFIEDYIETSELKREVTKLINSTDLTDVEREIVYHRFGLMGRKILVYEELKNIYNLSREGVRYIEKRALAKMAANEHIKTLTVFMDNPEQALSSLNKYQKTKKEKIKF